MKFYPKDADLYDFIKAQESMNGMVLDLLKQEKERQEASGEWPKE